MRNRLYMGNLRPLDCVYEYYFYEVKITAANATAAPKVEVVLHTVDPSNFQMFAKRPGFYLTEWLDTTYEEDERNGCWMPLNRKVAHPFNIHLLLLLRRHLEQLSAHSSNMVVSIPRMRSFEHILAEVTGAPELRTPVVLSKDEDNPFRLTKAEIKKLYASPEFIQLLDAALIPPFVDNGEPDVVEETVLQTSDTSPEQLWIPAVTVKTTPPPSSALSTSDARIDVVERRLDSVQSDIATILQLLQQGRPNEPSNGTTVRQVDAEQAQRDAEDELRVGHV